MLRDPQSRVLEPREVNKNTSCSSYLLNDMKSFNLKSHLCALVACLRNEKGSNN